MVEAKAMVKWYMAMVMVKAKYTISYPFVLKYISKPMVTYKYNNKKTSNIVSYQYVVLFTISFH